MCCNFTLRSAARMQAVRCQPLISFLLAVVFEIVLVCETGGERKQTICAMLQLDHATEDTLLCIQ
jgi:hypothetical protein